jgi:hypothetical protein
MNEGHTLSSVFSLSAKTYILCNLLNDFVDMMCTSAGSFSIVLQHPKAQNNILEYASSNISTLARTKNLRWPCVADAKKRAKTTISQSLASMLKEAGTKE